MSTQNTFDRADRRLLQVIDEATVRTPIRTFRTTPPFPCPVLDPATGAFAVARGKRIAKRA